MHPNTQTIIRNVPVVLPYCILYATNVGELRSPGAQLVFMGNVVRSKLFSTFLEKTYREAGV